jgi:hypothetical protein
MTITDIRTNDRSRTETAEYLAQRFCDGMAAVDERDRDRANDAFTEVDRGQFRHLDRNEAREAAVAHVDGLWATNRIERECTVDGEVDPTRVASADWGPVRSAFERRQWVVGLDEQYAGTYTTAWRNHLTGEDYWTPHMEAMCYEVRVAKGEPNYPTKPSDGHAGFGAEPARFALAVDLRRAGSERHRRQNLRNMQRYFEGILDAHGI